MLREYGQHIQQYEKEMVKQMGLYIYAMVLASLYLSAL